MTNIETKQKNKPTEKSVLLFSGGMDSLMYYYLLKPDIVLFIKHGNKYEAKELNILYKLIEKGYIPQEKVIINTDLQLGNYERDDAIIPMRNLLFFTIASLYGETIYIGAMNGDRTLDKKDEFFWRCKDMFNYLYDEQHWCEGRKFEICSPFRNLTKTQLVAKYIKAGGPKEALLVSYSCYEGNEKPCGWCKPCFRKFVALENNNIETKDYFENEPAKAPWLQEILPLIMEHAWRGDEDTDITKALHI